MRAGLVILAVGVALQSVPSSAGLYADDLTRCIVSKTSDNDKVVFDRWMFGAMTLHPAVRELSRVTDAQRAGFNQQVGDLMLRLLTQDCHDQAVTALKYEGEGSLSGSFEMLGRVAMQGLMSDPGMQQSLGALNTPVNDAKFKALEKEAGIPIANNPAK